MITPRTTRLLRAPDLHAFRHAAVELACDGTPFDVRNRLVILPTRAASAHLVRSIERRLRRPDTGVALPDFTTRADLYARLAARLAVPPALFNQSERYALMGVACGQAMEGGSEPPFRLRPGLIGEIVGLYDALQLNLKDVDAFERLALGMLEPGAVDDRGAERLVRQTHFLVDTFRYFERACQDAAGIDEHALRRQLLDEAAHCPWRHVVIAVGDRAGDPHGLFPADWDLLARLPGLERVDVVTTDAVVAGAFDQRIHQLLPGIEEERVDSRHCQPPPVLLVPPKGSLTHTARDREEEVAGFARWVRQSIDGRHPGQGLGETALVVRQPLPYVYVAQEVLRSAGVPCRISDALPLAAEPYAAALDLVFAAITSNFARRPMIALLRSPHFVFDPGGDVLTAASMVAIDRSLSEANYLGSLEALEHLFSPGDRLKPGISSAARRAGEVLVAVARELDPLRSPAPCAHHLDAIIDFLTRHERMPTPDDALAPRLLRGRAAVIDALTSLREAYARFDARPVEIDIAAAVVKRAIEEHTFAPETGDEGVHLTDAASARFGDFANVQLAGLVDGEWPDTPRRNIFYPPTLLRELGWSPESDRLDGIRASFIDLLRLPSSRLVVSTFTLEDDAIVTSSPLVDVVAAAALEAVEYTPPSTRIFDYEALALAPLDTSLSGAAAQRAAARRLEASRIQRTRPGITTGHQMSTYSVSALERYQDCGFKFFAADVLALGEPLVDEPGLSSRARGRFVHEVFQRFFEEWGARGHGAITFDRVDEARTLFEEVAKPMLARVPEAEASLVHARLFGSAVSTGIVDAVIELEASRPEDVRERWLECRLDGEFSLGVSQGRRVSLKGVADRVDLLAGDRIRVIDYKSGYPPNPKRALQAPVYALCAQERLSERDGRVWSIEEAGYVAFSGKRRLVPVVRAGGADTEEVLGSARDRLLASVDGIARGEFMPNPYDPRICSYCAYPSVCRKDYVGDE